MEVAELVLRVKLKLWRLAYGGGGRGCAERFKLSEWARRGNKGMRALNYKGWDKHELVDGKLKNEWSFIFSFSMGVGGYNSFVMVVLLQLN